MKKKRIIASLIPLLLLSSCDFGDIFDKVPQYKGMSVIRKLSVSDLNKSTRKISEVSTEGEMFLHKNEEFYFEIHFDNPKNYEIQSFTINDVKYANYMFGKGSGMEVLYLKSISPKDYGEYEYTIDAIKYIKNESIKDVKIKGEQTIKVSVEPYKVIVETNDSEKGTVTGGGKNFEKGDTTTLKATPKENYVFDGWYYDESFTNLASPDKEYVVNITDDVTLFAKFVAEDETLVNLPDYMLSMFEGYSIVRDISNNSRYLFGAYCQDNNKMRFATGEYEYSFRMMTTNNTTKGAAELEIKFVNDEEFTMQFIADGRGFDRKYIGIYEALYEGDPYYHLAFLDDPDQESYYDEKAAQTFTNLASRFKFYKKKDTKSVYTVGISSENFEVNKVFYLAITKDRENINYFTEDTCLDFNNYFMAHFYEKK